MVYTLLISLVVLVSIFMVIVVLIQESKGGGLSSNFSSQNSIMGVRKTTDVIEKLTWGLAAAMVVISVLCTYVAPTSTAEQSVLERESTTTNTATPGFPGASQSTPAAGAQKSAPAATGTKTAPVAPATPAK
ncbi:preprotein translocase subunit SecG [Segatella bryantii]|uniref:preprotein translocase subunit SecG n=1 Tax=Segatella bryantii TaxID=77095 RepID=UPI001EDABBA2|nr:preprotein translocase subunit SecG [Segatella bryantii]MDR4929843.1 preprotein translocase subunit SecG [Segatella bryantii]UKK75643.1 preprotein translocase subunit SecG [Segatella bryantii]